jgi:hypothetical protein
MRLIAPLLALAVAGIAARAAATSCYIPEPPWQDGAATPFDGDGFEDEADPVAVPLDAQPWERINCFSNTVIDPGVTCELVPADGAVPIPLTVEYVGTELCTDDPDAAVDDTYPAYIRRFIPPAPLIPGRDYRIDCSDGGPGTFHVRDSDERAAPPTALELVDTYYQRNDDEGCCGGLGDVLQLEFSEMDPAYLEEGGYIEAVYPGGQTLAFVRPQGDRFILPPVDGIIALTPVSASGVRGETVALDAGEVDGDLVYIPCDIASHRAGGRPGAALWLLAPIVLLAAQTRRRRRST